MSQWDGAAAAYLETLTAELHQAGVIGLFETQVRAVWHRNVNGYAPSEGDTSLSLGITCAENLRELIIGACSGESSTWRARGVMASSTDRSLRVDACGVRLGLMKAPPSGVRTPNWSGAAFRWDQESDVRKGAAERNSAGYRPIDSDQDGRQIAIPTQSDSEAIAENLRDLQVVWSGQLEEPSLQGGLAFPVWISRVGSR